ncbi:MAG: DUF2891 domain-containing protein [Parasphingorhabdus sp.]|nr:DUF2891 domain-containing protein [Parasphingorhabdus sp.]
MAQEVAYFSADGREAFERPYGMAWLLQLTAELREIAKGDGPKAAQAKIWMVRLEPLEAKIVVLLKGWLPKLAYPIRIGTHNQTAFAFGLMHDWAKMAGDDEMAELVRGKTLEFHAQDKNCPIGYEPSGEDFLSPCLMEADLMRRVMSPMGFANWLGEFLPQIPRDGTGDWLAPGVVRDKSDGKLVHLDGLNLSRAWALQGIAAALPEDDPRRASLLAAAKIHATVGEEAVANPSYAGSHWLASFATYLETKRGIAGVQPGTRGAPVAVTE